jgi:hypothetical protein
MAMRIYIDRVDSDGNQADEGISLDEWIHAVTSIENLRLCNEKIDNHIGSKYDAELLNKTTNEWIRVFEWEGDNASFICHDPGDDKFPLLKKAFELAGLNAVLLDEEGGIVTKDDFPGVFDK